MQEYRDNRIHAAFIDDYENLLKKKEEILKTSPESTFRMGEMPKPDDIIEVNNLKFKVISVVKGRVFMHIIEREA
ncbi:MAG: hypothetical protein M0R74_13865 [Dehalococcoidia bacterium]|jgi:hypothetical protein|nr:hypothetical protein [Dehalococcoidia bacterium]